MKNYLEWEERLKNSQIELNQDEIKEIKKIYQYHAKKFIQIINNINSKIKSISETKQFFFLLDTFKDEIVDVSPFLSKFINRIFNIIYKNNQYKTIAQYSYILEYCGNVKMIDILNDIIKNKSINKFLDTMEIYKIKKTIHELTNRFNKKDITIEIETNIDNPDLQWIDRIDNQG